MSSLPQHDWNPKQSQPSNAERKANTLHNRPDVQLSDGEMVNVVELAEGEKVGYIVPDQFCQKIINSELTPSLAWPIANAQ